MRLRPALPLRSPVDDGGRCSSWSGSLPGVGDLVVRAADLQSVAAQLRVAVAEADELPATADHAHVQWDIRGGPVSRAAADLVEAWWAALDLMADSGHRVLEWIDEVDQAYAEAERGLSQSVLGGRR